MKLMQHKFLHDICFMPNVSVNEIHFGLIQISILAFNNFCAIYAKH